MGSFFFHNCDWNYIQCEEDLNTLKHSLASAKDIKFKIQKDTTPNITTLLHDFFYYLYQKSPFTLKANKIKIVIEDSVLSNPSLGSMLLVMGKCVNKYMMCKKYHIDTGDTGENTMSSWFEDSTGKEQFNERTLFSKPKYIIKVTSNDIIYLITRVHSTNTYNSSNIWSYFGWFCIRDECWNINETAKYYLSSGNTERKDGVYYKEYDDLLPISVTRPQEKEFIVALEYAINKLPANNIKLFPIIVYFNIDHTVNSLQSSLFLDILGTISLNQTLIFVDFSFIIYIVDTNTDLYMKMKTVWNTIQSVRTEINYIARFYVFHSVKTDYLSYANAVKLQWKKAIALLQSKPHSYVMVYLFQKEIVKLNTRELNPYWTKQILSLEMSKDEAEYRTIKQSDAFKYRNVSNAGFVPTPYVPRFRAKVMSTSIKRFYSGWNFEIVAFISLTYKNVILKKLKRNSIWSVISKFLSISVKEETITGKNKDCIYESVFGIQLENRIPCVKEPRHEGDLHYDIVHYHYDQVFNLLNT